MDRPLDTLLKGLLAAGRFFPVMGAVTLCLAGVSYPSAVLIPVIGPVLLTTWLVLAGYHWSWIAVAWVADPASWYLRSCWSGWQQAAAAVFVAGANDSADLADENCRAIVGDSPDPDGD